MKKYFVLLLIVLSQPSVAAIDPAYYQFNSKSTYESAMEGWQNGVKIAEQAERTRQQREATREKANQASREESYRANKWC